MSKMRCRQCLWYNYDFFGHRYEEGKSFCGLHGRTMVDPDGEQVNLLGADKKGCGFQSAEIQGTLFDSLPEDIGYTFNQ